MQKMPKMLLFVRIGGRPAGEIPLSVAHTEPVFKTMWIQSKTGSEFFTASSDGTVSIKTFNHREGPYI